MEVFREAARQATLAAPTAVLRGIEALVRLGWQPPSRVSRAELAALFRDLTPPEVALAHRRAGWREVKWRVLNLLARRRGAGAVDPYVQFADGWPKAAEGAAILGTWHAGVPELVGIAAARLGPPVLSLRSAARLFDLPGARLFVVGGQPEHRAMGLKVAVEHLRAGGLVALALDGPGPAETLPCLGRPLRVTRGALELARWSGAPLLPLIASGSGPGPSVRVHFGPELALEAGKPRDAAARWLEAFLLRNPGEVRRDLARPLLGLSRDQARSVPAPSASAASRRSSR